MKTVLLVLLILPVIGFGQSTKQAQYYCIDHPGKTVYYSAGKAVVKKGLEKHEFYQYGFMKWKGWINKNWASLQYDFQFVSPAAGKKAAQSLDSLFAVYRPMGYRLEKVPMPYPMKPFACYKKDGSN